MKPLLIVLCILAPFVALGKSFKINEKGTYATILVKIEKFEQQKDGTIILTGELKQKKNFCYSVSFDGCNIITEDGTTIAGALTRWNNNSAGSKTDRTISDEESNKFIITFSNFNINNCRKFTLNLGTVLNREKTPIIFHIDLPKK